ncbi:M20 family metallo-hydrolase [Allokutzneria sp. A3M-2-11 16]|uniref:M20 family metallo-hydrolase n=1 Tax=Allokutzneria sp. A3M-2-11 16 TaxID=2962043 RepID=UPI0020B63CD4|nr:M20 family metallo-hydrolase [Allokutzneria sp. A3M-2-11 16]MCP3804985.1 M20 family metallo-hydrolase [Allokutzneria sp. A3M-2-11 16]
MTDLDLLAPNTERLSARIAELAGFHDSTFPGWSREVFSEPYRASRQWVREQMADAGLDVVIDAAGNIVGRLPGRRGGGPALVTGSHTDTVRQGGRFDGIVGVMAGIEVARRLRETGVQLEHDLVVVDFLGEEANDFGISCMGSRAIAGVLRPDHLDRTDGTGLRLGDALAGFGLDPDAALRQGWKSGDVHAYVELHVEQGPLLEQSGTAIGVVTAIAGIDRLLVHFAGLAGHAGTTPMADRRDALVSAAAAVLTVERVGCGAPVHGVATSGHIESSPGSMGVITDEARLWAEIRSVDRTWLHGARKQIVDEITAETRARGVDIDVDWLTDQDPVPTSGLVQDVIAQAADHLGDSWKAVPSGAGHDAAHLSRLGPMGMIFVPSVGGRSHCPEELTAAEDIARGAHVLASTLITLDRREEVRHA